MSVVEKMIPLWINSDPDNNDEFTRQTNGNSIITQTFSTPIMLPEKAHNVSVYVNDASLYNIFFNITQALNNNTFYITDDLGNMTKYQIVLSDGIWGVTGINDEIQRLLEQKGLPTKSVQMLGNSNSQRINWRLSVGYGVNFPINSPYKIIGYPGVFQHSNSGIQIMYVEAPDTAKFNNVESIYIHSDLTTQSVIPYKENVLCAFPVNASTGSLITYQPPIPLKLQASSLKNNKIYSARFEIRDQNGNLLRQGDGTESLSFRVCISYHVHEES